MLTARSAEQAAVEAEPETFVPEPPPPAPQPKRIAVVPEPAPTPGPPLQIRAPALDGERTVAILSEVLDDLGAAHHRPFSRD